MPSHISRRLPISPVNAGFAIGTLALVIVGWQALAGAARLRTEAAWVAHTFQVVGVIDRLDDLSRLAPHDSAARTVIVADLARVRRLTADNPSQLRRVDSLDAKARNDDWLMGPLLANMRAEEQDLLSVREGRVEDSSSRARMVISLTIVLAIGLMSAALVLLRQDLRHRRRAESALRESEAKHRVLMEQAADAILIVDSDAACIEGNARASEMMGRSSEEIPGLPLRAFVRPAKSAAGPVLPMLRFGHVTTGEFIVERPDGSTVPVEIRATILADGRVQVIARDISERKEVERAKDEFVSVVSHELRSPLTSIRGALGLLSVGKLDDDPVRRKRLLELAAVNTDRLIRLINDMLDVERMSAGAMVFEPTDISTEAIVSQAVEALRGTAERLGVHLRWSSDGCHIWADADRMTQTLTNLIDNAIKYSPDGAEVEVRVRAEGRLAHFEVADHGRGIPKELQETVFGRFQQVDASDSREKGGTGLGLAICRSIVEQHGGKIWVESEPGRGSTFHFTIPCSNGSPPATTE